MNNYKVYAHINKINGKIYIGMTQQELSRRFRHGYGYRNNESFYNDIKKYSWGGFEHIVLYSNLTEEEAIKKETESISKYDAMDEAKGYNRSRGGNGLKGWTPTEAQKIKSAKILSAKFSGKGNPFYGKHHNKEMRERLSEIAKERFKDGFPEEIKEKLRIANKGERNPFYGKQHSEETKAKFKAIPKEKRSMYGKKHKKETKELMSIKSTGKNNSQATKVRQYTIDYKFIKDWDCMADVESTLGIKQTSVSECCRKNYKPRDKKSIAKGFIWEYIGEPKQRKKVI